jgi:hypothetical protein
MNIPPEILNLVQQLTNDLDIIENRANQGLIIASQLLEHFPNNTSLINLSANLGNGLFFANSFRTRIESIIQAISSQNEAISSIQQAGEDLSEITGRVLECRMTVDRAASILEDLR